MHNVGLKDLKEIESCVCSQLIESNMIFKPQSAGIWDLTIKEENIIVFVHSLLTPFYVPRLPLHASMPACQLQPYLHINSKPSMSQERLKILKIEKSDFETYEKSPNPTCLREKTINPKLQLACFSLVHIKVQRNGTFHPKNIQLKNGFKRRICDCEFTTTTRTRTKS